MHIELPDITFGEGINSLHAEGAISALAEYYDRDAQLRLNFSSCRYVAPTAGIRLANALRPYCQSPGQLTAILPPWPDSSAPYKRPHRYFFLSGLAQALSNYSAHVLTPNADITALFGNAVLAYNNNTEYPAHSVLASGSSLALNSDSYNALSRQLTQALSSSPASRNDIHESTFADLARLVFECVQNIHDHAHKYPLPSAIRTHDFVSLSYHKQIHRHPHNAELFEQYIQRVLDTTFREDRNLRGFLEICVNDDGVGIAGRQAQSAKVYTGPIEEELESFWIAMSPGGTVKHTAPDAVIRQDPGFGTEKIATALKSVSGLAVLRTGRLELPLDGTLNEPIPPRLESAILPYMPGTSLHILVPLAGFGDAQMHLFHQPRR